MTEETPTTVQFLVRARIDQREQLDLARARDRIDRSTRVRAMIDLWMLDPAVRERVNAIALGWLKEPA
jgi:hypothetical protein